MLAMTDTCSARKLTLKQLRLLRELVLERDESFAVPTTRAQASLRSVV